MTTQCVAFLKQSQPVDSRHVYVIGCFERRLTIHSQQTRAFNLIYSLFKTDRLKIGHHVIIVGGGISGVTAAAAASAKGCRVTLLERKSRLMHLQQGCHTRWVHPSIYDWPADENQTEKTQLPFLNWEAARAGDVVEQLLREWAHRGSAVTTHLNVTEISKLDPANGRLRLAWRTANEGSLHNSELADVIILAVGYGVEVSVEGHRQESYWRNDAIDQPRVASGGPSHVLVSGCGDGGMTDLLRLRIESFRQERIVEDFFGGSEVASIVRRLREIKADMAKQPRNSDWLRPQPSSAA